MKHKRHEDIFFQNKIDEEFLASQLFSLYSCKIITTSPSHGKKLSVHINSIKTFPTMRLLILFVILSSNIWPFMC